mgnify:FL=1
MDMQKQEMREAVELPLSHFDLYKQIGKYKRGKPNPTKIYLLQNFVTPQIKCKKYV